MELNKILDLAIMKAETEAKLEIKSGYKVDSREEPYENYLDNNSWNIFVNKMKEENPAAYRRYGSGGGKELEERKVGKNIYPPKMASFGSSSRMIYNLAKDTDYFLFEEKLPTVVGGMANLDGFMETEDKCIFVEAKCREPYSKKTSIVDRNYEKLYEYISNSTRTSVTCIIKDLSNETKNKTKMNVTFMYGETEIKHFDLKQMICHLLGVAHEFLRGNSDIKKIKFIYLLFNPNLIDIDDSKEKIHKIYNETCDECNLIDFKALFDVVVEYLLTLSHYKWENATLSDGIVDNFNFALVDQASFLKNI